jgi:hypothetical protein
MKPPGLHSLALNARFILSILLILSCLGSGCGTPPKPISKPPGGSKLTYWEFKELSGVDAEDGPEARQLRRDGWIFMGYSLPYPNEDVRIDFPAGYPVVMGKHGRYSSSSNSICAVAHFRRIAKVVDAH